MNSSLSGSAKNDESLLKSANNITITCVAIGVLCTAVIIAIIVRRKLRYVSMTHHKPTHKNIWSAWIEIWSLPGTHRYPQFFIWPVPIGIKIFLGNFLGPRYPAVPKFLNFFGSRDQAVPNFWNFRVSGTQLLKFSRYPIFWNFDEYPVTAYADSWSRSQFQCTIIFLIN